jgi:hypothetical protein
VLLTLEGAASVEVAAAFEALAARLAGQVVRREEPYRVG